MRRLFCIGVLLFSLTGCGTAGERYCADYVDPNDDSYARCLGHFNAQQTAFDADKDTCEALATLTYPENFRTSEHIEPPMISLINSNGHVAPHESAREDFAAPWDKRLERDRDHAVRLCMYKMGWNSPDVWQAGHHPYPTCAKCKAKKKPHITVVNTKKHTSKTL